MINVLKCHAVLVHLHDVETNASYLDMIIRDNFQKQELVPYSLTFSYAFIFFPHIVPPSPSFVFPPDIDFEACASLTDGYTSSDITALCGAAVSVLQQERRTTVQKRDIALARKNREDNKNNNKIKNKDLSSLLSEVDNDGIKGSEIPLRPLRMQVRIQSNKIESN